jgi:YVTN family beta-propeller protein
MKAKQLSWMYLAAAVFLSTRGDAATAPKGVFVVNTKGASVSLVDLTSNQEIRKIEVGSTPYGVAVVQDGKILAVGVEGEEKVKFYDMTKGFRLVGETKIGKMHNDHIQLTQDGKYLAVANFYSDNVVGIDLKTRKIAYRLKGLSAPHVIKYGPLKQKAYVTCKKETGIGIVDLATRKVLKVHSLNVNPRSLTFSPDEKKIYFGSFWVDGFFEMDAESGQVTRLFHQSPPEDNAAPQEVTYHGVEAINESVVLAANEGRSFVDSVDVQSGKRLDRLTGISKPCCIERVPDAGDGAVRVLISAIGDGSMSLVEVSKEGKLKSLAKIPVGEAPKRVAFVAELPAKLTAGE